MNGQLIIVFCVQIVLIYGQPIFNPMAGHVGGHIPAPVSAPFGLPIPFDGVGGGYAGGGAGFPLLSPMELNAIMEAEAKRGAFKGAFVPDTEPRGFAGFGGNNNNNPYGFMANYEEGFSGEGNSDFYEAPQHDEPLPVRETDEKRPEPKARDNRGAYHKDVEGRPEDDRARQRGGYRDEDRDGESNLQNEPASGGAYREYRGEGAAAEEAERPDGPDGPEPNAGGSDKEDGPPEHYRNHASAYQEDQDQGGPNESAYEPKERPSGKQATSGGYTSDSRRPVRGNDYSPRIYQDDARVGGAYRPTPNQFHHRQ